MTAGRAAAPCPVAGALLPRWPLAVGGELVGRIEPGGAGRVVDVLIGLGLRVVVQGTRRHDERPASASLGEAFSKYFPPATGSAGP
jgi:hypothetical protein